MDYLVTLLDEVRSRLPFDLRIIYVVRYIVHLYFELYDGSRSQMNTPLSKWALSVLGDMVAMDEDANKVSL